MKKAKKIVVIGGGTGSFAVLSGLKKYPRDTVELAAIVTMADSGGSTGRLRDEFGYLPVGDVRQALVALADDEHNLLLRQLFMHRFDKGDGLSGHNFGNLLLVALTDILGDEAKAIRAAERILHASGRVLPVTTDNCQLVACYDDGSVVRGEAHVDEPGQSFDEKKHVVQISLSPKATANTEALKAIDDADLVILGPGDLYTSILPNVIVGGVADALKDTKAHIVHVLNLMTRFGQTHDYPASTFISEIEQYVGRSPDFVLVNSTALPDDMLKRYAKEKEYPVKDDLSETASYTTLRRDLISEEISQQSVQDSVKRSLVRHDPDKLAQEIMLLHDRTFALFETS